MKKFFCFHCQTQVNPFSFWKYKICPQCKHLISDDGEGFYMVCDKCGANLPPDAQNCLKCGHSLYGGQDIDVKTYDLDYGVLNWVITGLLFILSVIIGIGVLYISFYAIFFIVFIGLVMFIFNLLKSSRNFFD